ncbi:MAG: bifunctional diaminohydroxyphosphoribosylaminopyrimidine deaminase/5-amino-6-(5-phosphoribosylamino)uracil reductase RibD [Planctomycetota bacterium]|jgi:diaminohydroxyphosphoribosylaminopyrimidine deaminase/5-amino-6-(5-phosphoribosylamino)uracil reductase
MAQNDTEYMQLAIDLAKRGSGSVEPNPAVGCVIANAGGIIGKGWHKQFGAAHAEVNALADCYKNGYNPAGATMYVTLEPCSHTGKTPPCSQAVIEAEIASIFIASPDPTDLAGGGIDQLKQAGIEVHTGLCQEKAEALNPPFYKLAQTGHPWVVLKWAQSIDGKLAWKNPPAEGNWISNEQSRADVHRLRNTMDGILTGIDTVLADNPKLTVRAEGQTTEQPPLRIVLDSKLRIGADCRLMTTTEAPTLIVTTQQTASDKPEKIAKLTQAGVEVETVQEHDGHCDLNETLTLLGKRGIGRLMIEAGPTLLTAFLKQNLADQAHIYIAPLILGQDGDADITTQMNQGISHQPLKNVTVKTFNRDVLVIAIL